MKPPTLQLLDRWEPYGKNAGHGDRRDVETAASGRSRGRARGPPFAPLHTERTKGRLSCPSSVVCIAVPCFQAARPRFLLVFVTATSAQNVRPPRSAGSDLGLPDGWTTNAPRDEVRPALSFEPNGGPKKTGSFVVVHDGREGLDGWFQKSFPVTGGEYYRFRAVRKTVDVSVPRRSALVRVLWRDKAGNGVSADVPEEQVKQWRNVPSAEPEHPVDGATDANGWTTVSGVYRASDAWRRGPWSSCTCNGLPAGAWSGARWNLRRPLYRRAARCGWRRCTTNPVASRRERTAKSSLPCWPRPPPRRPILSCWEKRFPRWA